MYHYSVTYLVTLVTYSVYLVTLHGHLLGHLLGHWLTWSSTCSLTWSLNYLFTRSITCSLVRLLAHLRVHILARLLVRSLGHLLVNSLAQYLLITSSGNLASIHYFGLGLPWLLIYYAVSESSRVADAVPGSWRIRIPTTVPMLLHSGQSLAWGRCMAWGIFVFIPANYGSYATPGRPVLARGAMHGLRPLVFTHQCGLN